MVLAHLSHYDASLSPWSDNIQRAVVARKKKEDFISNSDKNNGDGDRQGNWGRLIQEKGIWMYFF